jgi:hypothetical protein
MNDAESLLRNIPNVDRLLRSPILADAPIPRAVLTEAVRRNLPCCVSASFPAPRMTCPATTSFAPPRFWTRPASIQEVFGRS